MRKIALTLLASIAAASFLPPTAAQASTYAFSFQATNIDLQAAGEIEVNAADEITAVSGEISGVVSQTIAGIAGNPNFPNPAYSADGSFIFDNVYHASGAPLDVDGLLFTTAQNPGGYWNLWASGSGVYSLYKLVGSYNYAVQGVGALNIAAAPELSTWAMLALGFAGLSFAGFRRPNRLVARSLV